MKTEVFDDLINFMVSAIPPGDLIAFRPSPRAQERFNQLSEAVKSGVATPEELAEVERSLFVEHLMRLAKARARRKIADAA